MLALLYDVHGNLPALEAVVADARRAGADRWVLGGDYVAFGGWPADCLALLRDLDGGQWIRGNTERWLAEPPEDERVVAALSAAAAAIGDDAVAFLVALPLRLTLAEGHFCHASPLNDMESFGVEEQPGEDRLIDGVKQPRVVFGHTHVQFRRVRDDGLELINPGSVGIPLDGDHRAAYALIGDDGSVELRRVAYDHEAAAAQAREVAGEVFAQRILEARFVP